MKSRTSFSVNTTTSETIAFEDEFNGLAGSISSSIGLPSDTLAAIQVLKQEFPKYNNLAVIPVMLEHHIYSIITDRTAGMKELDQLISDNILKNSRTRYAPLLMGPFFVLFHLSYNQKNKDTLAREAAAPFVDEAIVRTFPTFLYFFPQDSHCTITSESHVPELKTTLVKLGPCPV